MNVTSEAISIGQRHGAQLYNFNVIEDKDDHQKMKWVVGKAEETLVELANCLADCMTIRQPGKPERMRLCAW